MKIIVAWIYEKDQIEPSLQAGFYQPKGFSANSPRAIALHGIAELTGEGKRYPCLIRSAIQRKEFSARATNFFALGENCLYLIPSLKPFVSSEPEATHETSSHGRDSVLQD